jgi:hypothetical protein
MPDQKYPQFSRNVFLPRSDDTVSAQPLRGVRQDKVALTSDRKGTKQPASVSNGIRSDRSGMSLSRSQNHPARTRAKVPFTLHVDPIIKAEVHRQAEINGISASAEGSDLLEAMLRQKLHIQQAATLETVLEKIITRAISRRDARLAHLLVRIAFAAEQGRGLDSTILSRMPGMTPALHDKILDRSAKAAKKKITHSSPQLEDSMKELEEMLSQKEGRAEKT